MIYPAIPDSFFVSAVNSCKTAKAAYPSCKKRLEQAIKNTAYHMDTGVGFP